MKNHIVIIEGVDYYYKTGLENINYSALKNINIKICEGEFVVIIGRNGSGKSTMAKLLNALLVPLKGSVIVNSYDTKNGNDIWDIRESMGMVFQNPDNQMIATSVEDDVAFGPENLGIKPEEIKKRVYKALEDVEMIDYLKDPPHKLSGGQKQRVAIAGILAMKPKCIILDEATSMLDPEGRKEVLSVLKRLNRDEKITIIHITHHMEEAKQADRVIVVHDGQIYLQGTPNEVFKRVEEIKKMGLEVPQITELFFRLRKEGYNMREDIISDNEAIEEISKLINEIEWL